MSEEIKQETVKKIPRFVNNPIVNRATAPELKLFRPKINYFKAFLYLLAHFAAGLLIAIIWAWIENGDLSEPFTRAGIELLIIITLLFIITLRFSLIWFVRLYQHYAKSETRLRCCMKPSCSEYAILAFKKYGAIWGGIKTWKRLHRCHPPGGVDYP